MKKTLLAAAIATAFAFPALAHDVSGEPAHPDQHEFSFKLGFDGLLADAGASAATARATAEATRAWAQDFASGIHESMAFLFSDRVGRGKVVKGAPYSAEVITETNQPLADGNAITHKSTSRIYRDGEGRTRQETIRDNEVRSVYISDPVEGTNYTLIPGSKVAVKVPRVEFRHETRSGRERDKTSSSTTSKDGERSIVCAGKGDRPPHAKGAHKVVRIGGTSRRRRFLHPPTPPTSAREPHRFRPLPLPPVPGPLIPGMNTMHFESMGHWQAHHDSHQDLDGVKAEGKSTV